MPPRRRLGRRHREGIATGELGDQDPQIRGAAIVGAFLEGVVAPLAARPVDADRRDEVGREIAALCQNAVTGAAIAGGTGT